jgi:DNA-binding NarL/FixJ family response regulator
LISHPEIVLVVDEDERYRSLMVSILTAGGFDARSVASGEDALAALPTLRPSTIILDIRLPGISGYEVCRRVREDYGEEIGIVFVSGVRAEPIDRVASLLIGADDHLAKPFAPDELTARVRRLGARRADSSAHPEPPRSSHNGHRSRTPLGGTEEYGLTGRELEVLDLLASGYDQADVAERLVVSRSTVATHIQRILGKLEVHNRAQAVGLALREGLVEGEA